MDAIVSFFDQYGALMAQGTLDSVVMTVLSTAFAYAFGIPLGVLLVLTAPGGLHPHRVLNSAAGWLVNIGRSVPFIILIVFIIPRPAPSWERRSAWLQPSCRFPRLPFPSSPAWSSRACRRSTRAWSRRLRALERR